MMTKRELEEACNRYMQEEPDTLLKAEIMRLMKSHDEKDKLDLIDRMHTMIRFGTAGIRAKMEGGYNRINKVTVYRLSFALGQDLQRSKKQNTVVIGFDGRNNSRDYALEAAQTLAYFGHKIFMFEDGVPTPLCAYATKKLCANVGVMITASHNPKEDNGIKLYQGNSAQLCGEILHRLMEGMDRAPLRHEFDSQQPPSWEIIPKSIFEDYLKDVKETRFFDELPANKVAIVYTPLHGVGKDLFIKALNNEGTGEIAVVSSQANPDGQFPTVAFPNPEEEYTLDLAYDLALKENVAFVFANDPDADRLQVSVKRDSKFEKLSGNEMGTLLAYFSIARAKRKNIKPILSTSIVSSRMLKAMCQALGVSYTEALTGFSNIVDQALLAQSKGMGTFLFGYEEAIGFLIGDVVLDKDGIHSGTRFMEIIRYLQNIHKTVWEFLDELYIAYGLFQGSQWSFRFSGPQAMVSMSNYMKRLRALSGFYVADYLQWKSCQKYDLNQEQMHNDYAGMKANVVIFETPHERLIVRPSGTEPKIKFYLELHERATNQHDLSMKRIELGKRLFIYREQIEKLLGG